MGSLCGPRARAFGTCGMNRFTLEFVVRNKHGVEVLRFSDYDTELRAAATLVDALREMEASFIRAEREARRLDGTVDISMHHRDYARRSVEYASPDAVRTEWIVFAALAADIRNW